MFSSLTVYLLNKKIGNFVTKLLLYVLGDLAYSLKPFLMTPKLNQVEGTPGARYTDYHVRTRSAVERCFGILKGRWRCLRKERALHYTPEISGNFYYLIFLFKNNFLIASILF